MSSISSYFIAWIQYTRALSSVGVQANLVRSVGLLQALAVKHEPHRLGILALALAVGVHQPLERRLALDLEEDLVVVLCVFRVFVRAWCE